MKVDIYIKQKSINRDIRIPLLPEEITVMTGDGKFISYDIMGKGEVALPAGVGLSTISWESEFPGANWPDPSMLRETGRAPSFYHALLKKWKSDNVMLNIMVTGYPINMDVYISKYSAKASGPFGGLAYEIEFIEAKNITVKTTTTATSNAQSSSAKRSTETTTTYVVKSGDNCWNIALKYYKNGLEWPKIYKANKEIIEQTAKKYGRSSSDNGWWIYPGIRLVIP